MLSNPTTRGGGHYGHRVWKILAFKILKKTRPDQTWLFLIFTSATFRHISGKKIPTGQPGEHFCEKKLVKRGGGAIWPPTQN